MKLLITGAWKATDEQLDTIQKLGHDIVLQPQEADPLACPAEDVEGVIGNGLFLHHPIEKFLKLRYIQLTSAGFDRVPMDYVKSHGIEIHNARGVYSIPMAEHAVAGVLTLYRRFHDFHDLQKERKWQKIRDLEELHNKTVVIVGCGNVGTECAKRFAAFGCHVIGVDIVVREDDNYQQMLPLKQLDDSLPTADIVILTLPLTDETRHLLDSRRLSLLKNHAIVVNIARGAVVEQSALSNELASNRLRAVLDVFEEEPLSNDSVLWNLPNVVLTPHNSFIGDGDATRLADVIKQNLIHNLAKSLKLKA